MQELQRRFVTIQGKLEAMRKTADSYLRAYEVTKEARFLDLYMQQMQRVEQDTETLAPPARNDV